MSGKEPRYYQRIAINRSIEAISKGQKRLLLVMATGTGKTYTAFQIIWRLRKAASDRREAFRVLILADRNLVRDSSSMGTAAESSPSSSSAWTLSARQTVSTR